MSWQSYSQSLLRYPQLGFSLDLSLMDIEPSYFEALAPQISKAFADMEAVESGAKPIPTKGAWSATTGCATPISHRPRN